MYWYANRSNTFVAGSFLRFGPLVLVVVEVLLVVVLHVKIDKKSPTPLSMLLINVPLLLIGEIGEIGEDSHGKLIYRWLLRSKIINTILSMA